MTKIRIRFARLAMALVASAWSLSASAQVPVPGPNTPTLHGGTPIVGKVVSGEVGFAALRGSVYFGSTGDRDFGVELSAPTFANDRFLPGWGQSLGLDIRAPFRIRLAQWPKATGSLKIGPYFHAGRACSRRNSDCGVRSVGIGPQIGFVTDIALPKLFKLIVGIEQQFGLLHFGSKNTDASDNVFAAATWLDLGLEAFWRERFFFTMIINAGAQYGSDRLYDENHALYRHMFGFGYKWQ